MLFLVFLLAGLLLIYLLLDYYLAARRDRVLERLKVDTYDSDEGEVSLWGEASSLFQTEAIRELLYSSVITRKFDRYIKRSGLPITLMNGIAVMAAAALIPAVMTYYFFGSFTAVIIGFFAAPLVLWIILKEISEQVTKKHDRQLPALIATMLTTIRSGGTPVQALQAASRNSPSPMRESITNILDLIQLGRSPSLAWQEWAEFWGTRACKLLSTGIRLKWEAGGQMTNILQHIQETLEFHNRMELRVSTLTAQAKLSAWILSSLPIGLAILTYSYRPDLFNTMLTDERGTYLLWYVGLSTVIGFIWLRRIARLKD